MAQNETALTGEQKLWAAMAALIFVVSLALLGFAIKSGTMLAFAIGWPVLQVFGYTGSLKRAGGDTAHPLFKSQVMLNAIVIALLLALILRTS